MIGLGATEDWRRVGELEGRDGDASVWPDDEESPLNRRLRFSGLMEECESRLP